MNCKLVIKDEVNVKFEGLDVSMRRKLMMMFKYKLPYAYHIPAVRLGRWDGCVNFFQLGGSTYLNLVADILPVLEKAGYDIVLEDKRNNSFKIKFTEIDENFFCNYNWPKGKDFTGEEPVSLRDYQVELVNNFLNDPQCVQEIATGAGKTLMTAALSRSVEQYGRSIVIVPNKKLVEQTSKDYKMLGLDVGVFYGKQKDYTKTHTICTWQSLNSLNKKTKNSEAIIPIGDFIDEVVAVIVDEVHLAKAEVLKTMLSSEFANIPIRWGLTGTIPKEQHFAQAIKCTIGHVVGQKSAAELIEEGHLARCEVNVIQTQDDISYNDYQQELKYLTTNDKRIKYIARLLGQISLEGNTLVLVDRKATGYLLEELLDNAVFVHGTTKDKVRDEHYDSIKELDGKIIIATYGIAAVGLDIPRIFNMVLFEAGKSFVRVIQSIGRGIRKAEDKDFVQIWDLCSSAKYSKRHLAKRKVFYRDAEYPFTIEKTEIK